MESGQTPPFQHVGGTEAHGLNLRGIFNTILLTVLANLWWIVLLFLGLNLADQFRFDKYYNQNKDDDSAPFRPLLFWHHADSRWYERMTSRMEEDDDDEEDEDKSGPTNTGGAGQQRDHYQRGPGYSTDPNEPGPFSPPTDHSRRV